jgi:ATP-dependent protease HslVU (ClpYQ) peptidase subunit
MTVIIGYDDTVNRTMYMGCDTVVTQSDFIKYHLKSKIQRFDSHSILVGYAGHLQPVYHVRSNFSPPDVGDCSLDSYVHLIAKEMKELVDECICEGEVFGALVGIHGKFFDIDERGLLREAEYPFSTIGSGEKTAFGSLLTSIDYPTSIEDKVNKALEVTSKIIWNVQEPFVIEKMKY